MAVVGDVEQGDVVLEGVVQALQYVTVVDGPLIGSPRLVVGPPIPQHPIPSAETCIPVAPRRRVIIGLLLAAGAWVGRCLTVHWPGRTGAELAAALSDMPMPWIQCAISPDGPWLVATSAGVTKASALETLRVELGVAQSETLAVGDGVNDLEMLAWAAHGVAMGHAPDVVRAAADEVCPPVIEDGLATLLARWF